MNVYTGNGKPTLLGASIIRYKQHAPIQCEIKALIKLALIFICIVLVTFTMYFSIVLDCYTAKKGGGCAGFFIVILHTILDLNA